MAGIPGSPGSARLDRTLALALDGYEFIGKRCQRHGPDLFQTRLLLQPTICVQGADAAR
jgi:fatty-acid peroxygenase